MEILVVLAIFSLLDLVIVDVYLLAIRAQRQTSFRQKTLSNIRYTMEVIAQQVRTSEVDYTHSYDEDGDSGIAGPEKSLALKDPDGNKIVYRFNNLTKEIQVESGGQIYPLTNSNELEVVGLDFYINPPRDPFLEERCNRNSGLDNPFVCQDSAIKCSICPDEPQDCTLCSVNPDDLNCVQEDLAQGFCECDSDDDCRTGYCDSDEGLCLPANQQPRVTVALAFTSKGIKAEQQKTVFLQTTVSSRVYRR